MSAGDSSTYSKHQNPLEFLSACVVAQQHFEADEMFGTAESKQYMIYDRVGSEDIE